METERDSRGAFAPGLAGARFERERGGDHGLR